MKFSSVNKASCQDVEKEQSLNQRQRRAVHHALDFSFQSVVFTVCREAVTTANVLVPEHQSTWLQYWNT